MIKVYKYYDCKKKGLISTVARVFLIDVVLTVILNTYVMPAVRRFTAVNR